MILFLLAPSLASTHPELLIVSRCSGDLDGDGEAEIALMVSEPSATGATNTDPKGLLVWVLDSDRMTELWEGNVVGETPSLTCTPNLQLGAATTATGEQAGPISWVWDGSAYTVQNGAVKPAVAAPTRTPCPEHKTCDEYGLEDCMCDDKGALHSAIAVCDVKFDPPCPAGTSCDANAAQEWCEELEMMLDY